MFFVCFPFCFLVSFLCLYLFSFFCVVLLCVFTFCVPCCDVRHDFLKKTMFGSSLPLVVCRRVHVLFTLYVFVYVYWCPTHNVVCFCFVCLRLVYPMLPVSLDCPFVIAPSVFSNLYLLSILYVLLRNDVLDLCFILWYKNDDSPGRKVFSVLSSFFPLLSFNILLYSLFVNDVLDLEF